MTTLTPTKSPFLTTTTSYGGENIVGFRVIKSFAANRKDSTTKPPRTLAEADAWLLANAAKVDAHAKASTKRLIGRESV